MSELIPIRSRRGVIEYATVDAEDYPHLSQYRWSLMGGYPRTAIGQPQRHFKMHRLIMPRQVGMTIDHINGDKLDNRKCNLRLCTDRQNNLNRPKQSNNKTGYKGVFIEGRTGMYVAQIRYAGRRYRLGQFTDPRAAYDAYCKACHRLHGEYANVG